MEFSNVDNDALIAQQLYEEELRCINDEQIARLCYSSDQQAMDDQIRKLRLVSFFKKQIITFIKINL